MGTDTIILAVGKWKRHCVFLPSQARSAEDSSPPFAASGQHSIGEPSLVCTWPLLLLFRLPATAGRTGFRGGVQHLVEDTTVPLTMGSAFLSAPL